jgi:hypothetical protein
MAAGGPGGRGFHGPWVPSLIAGVAWRWLGWVGRTVMGSQAVTAAGAQGQVELRETP